MSLTLCGKIQADITLNCVTPVTGLKDRLVLINYDDVDFDNIVYNATNPMLVETLALKGTTRGYLVQGINMSNKHNAALAPRPYMNGYEHNINFIVFDNDPASKLWLDNLTHARLVGIWENRYKKTNGDTSFEIGGLDVGLNLLEGTRDADNEETLGGWLLSLRTGNSKEPHAPRSYFITDYATTNLAFESLYETSGSN